MITRFWSGRVLKYVQLRRSFSAAGYSQNTLIIVPLLFHMQICRDLYKDSGWTKASFLQARLKSGEIFGLKVICVNSANHFALKQPCVSAYTKAAPEPSSQADKKTSKRTMQSRPLHNMKKHACKHNCKNALPAGLSR